MEREGSSAAIKSNEGLEEVLVGTEEEYDVRIEQLHEEMQNNVILHGEKHVTVARNITAIGDYYLAKQSFLAAREYYEKALNMLVELFGNANEETIDAHYRLANLVALQTEGTDSRETRNLNTKIRSLREQFDQLLDGNKEVQPTLVGGGTLTPVSHGHRTNITKENSIDSTLVYSDIADEARMNGDYEEAQRMYLKALELRRKKYGPKSAALTPVLLSYAEMLRLDGNLKKAQGALQEALEINLETYGKHSEYVAEVYNSLGQLYKQRGEVNEADTVLLEALRIRRLNFGEYHPAIGSTLNNLAEVARERLDFITSLSYHATAVEAFEKSVGVDHVGYVNAKGNLGLTLRRQAQIGLEKGEQLVKNAVEFLALKKYDSRHPWVVKFSLEQTIHRAQRLYNESKFEQAAELYQNVVNKKLEAFKRSKQAAQTPLDRFMATADMTMLVEARAQAVIQLYNEKLGRSNAYYDIEKGLQSCLKSSVSLGESHDLTTQLSLLRANTLFKLGYYEKSLEIYLEILKIRTDVYGPDHVHVAHVMIDLGEYYILTASYIESETILTTALTIITDAINLEPAEMQGSGSAHASSFVRCGLLLMDLWLKTGSYGNVSPLLAQCTHVCDKALGQNNPLNMQLLHVQCAVLMIQGKYSDAHKLALSILDSQLQLYGKEHLQVASTFKLIATIDLTRGQDLTHARKYVESAKQMVLKIIIPPTNLSPSNSPIMSSTQVHIACAELDHLRGDIEYELGDMVAAEASLLAAFEQYKNVSISTVGSGHPGCLAVLRTVCKILVSCGFVQVDLPASLGVTQNDIVAIIEDIHRRQVDVIGNPLHLDTLLTTDLLSSAYVLKGEINDACVMLQDNLGKYEEIYRAFGSDTKLVDSNVYIVADKLQLAAVYRLSGRISEAKELVSTCGIYISRVVGDNSLISAVALYELACISTIRGKYKDAKYLLSRSVATNCRIRSGSVNNPLTVHALLAAAVNISEVGYLDDAMKTIAHAVDIQSKMCKGNTNNMTMSMLLCVQAKLMCDYGTKEKVNQAEILLLSLLDTLPQVLGNECNLWYLQAYIAYARYCCIAEKHDDAIALYEKSMKIYASVFGENTATSLYFDIQTGLGLTQYCSVKYEIGQRHVIEFIQKNVLPVAEKFYGKSHPKTMNSHGYIALCKNQLEEGSGDKVIDDLLLFLQQYNQIKYCAMHPWIVLYGGFNEKAIAVTSPLTSPVTNQQDSLTSWALPANGSDTSFVHAKIPDDHIILTNTDSIESWGSIVHKNGPSESPIYTTPPKFSPLGGSNAYGMEDIIPLTLDNQFSETPATNPKSVDSATTVAVSEVGVDKEDAAPNDSAQTDTVVDPILTSSVEATMTADPIDPVSTSTTEGATAADPIDPVSTSSMEGAMAADPVNEHVADPVAVDDEAMVDTTPVDTDTIIEPIHGTEVGALDNIAPSVANPASSAVSNTVDRKPLANDKVSRAINAAEFLFERASGLHGEGTKANYSLAQPLFNEACLVMTLNQPQTEQLALYLYTSGKNLQMYCCLEQAHDMFNASYEICQGLASDSGKALLIAVMKAIIQSLAAMGKPLDALSTCQLGLETASKLYDLTSPIVGLALLQCAEALIAVCSINEAKAQCDKGYAIINKACGTRDVKIADAFYLRALVAKMQGKLKEAKPLVEQALAIRRNFLGDKHQDIADCMLLMGLCLLDMGKPEEASLKFQQCIDMRNVYYGNMDDLRILDVSYCQAQVLCKTGKYYESLKLHNRILSLRQSMLSSAHISISDSYQGIAENLLAQGKYHEALLMLQQALTIRKATYVARSNERVAQTLCSIARVYCSLGNFAECKEYVEASLTIRRDIFTKNHWLYLQSQHEQVNLMINQEQWSQAYTLCMRTLKARKELLGDDHPDFADSLVAQGICLCAEGSDSSLSKAKEVINEALAIRKMLFGNSLEVAECMNLLGVVCLCDLIPYTEERFSLDESEADEKVAVERTEDFVEEKAEDEGLDGLLDEENNDNEEVSVRSADTLERTDDGVPIFNNSQFRSLIDRFYETQVTHSLIHSLTYSLTHSLTQTFLETLSNSIGGSEILLAQVKANIGIVQRLEYDAEKKFDASLGIADRKSYRDAKNLALLQKSSTDSKSNEDVLKDFVVPGVTAIRNTITELVASGFAEKHPLVVRLAKHSKTKEEKPSDFVVAKRALMKAEGYRHLQYQYFAASHSYDDAIASFIEAFGPAAANVNLDVATTILGKAEVLSALGYYKRSNMCLAQYTGICQKASGDKSILTAKGSFCRAENMRKMGKLEDSKAMHESVLQLKIELYGKFHPEVAESYRAMADVNHEMGAYVEATKWINKAFYTLDLYSQSQGSTPSDVQDPLQKAEFHYVSAKIHLATAKFEDAIVAVTNALSILSSKFSADDRHPLYSGLYLVQASCAMWKSEYADAMKYANKALSIRVIYFNRATNKRKFFNDKLAESKIDFMQALERLSKVATTQYPEEDSKPLFAGMDINSMKQSFSSKTSVKPFVFMGDVVASHPLVAEAVYLIGDVRLQQGKLLEAMELFKFVKVMRDDVFENDPAMNGPTMLGIAYAQRKLGELSESESTYQALLDICLKSLGENHPLKADTMAEYGDLLFQLCKFNSCDIYFAEASKIYQHVYEDAHPKKVMLLVHTASIMQFHGRYTEANESYKRAAEMVHKTIGDSCLLGAIVTLNQAKCAKDQGIYQLSVSLVDQAMGIVSSVLGEGHYLLHSCLCNLAETLRQQGKFLEARKSIMQCLVGQREVLGNKHPDTVASLLVLANITLDLANYKLSRLIFESSLAYTRRIYGENHTEVAACISGLAETASYEAKYKESINLHEAALLLRRKIFGDKHQHIAQSVYYRACLSLRVGRYDEAIQGFDDSLAMRRLLFGQVHRDIAQSLYGLASAFVLKGKLSEARAMHERALSMRRTILGDHVEVYESQYATAMLDQLHGKYEQAIVNVERCYEKQRIARGSTHPVIATLLNSMGSLSCILGRYAESKSYLFEALNMRKTVFEQDYIHHPDIEDSMFTIAEYLRAIGLYDVATPDAVVTIDLKTVIVPFEDAIAKTITKSSTGKAAFEPVSSAHKGEDEKICADIMESVTNMLTHIIDNELVPSKQKNKIASDDADASNVSTTRGTSLKKRAPSPAPVDISPEKVDAVKTEEYRSALSLYRRVLSRQLELYGSEHLCVLKTQSVLAETLKCLGNYNAAYEILEHVYITSKRVLGSEHYDSVEVSCMFADMLRTVAKIYPHSEREEPRVAAAAGNRSLAPKLEEHVGSIMGFGPVTQLEPLNLSPTHLNESVKSNSFLFPPKSKKAAKIIPYQGGYQGYAYPASKKQASLTIVAASTSSTHDCKAIYEEALMIQNILYGEHAEHPLTSALLYGKGELMRARGHLNRALPLIQSSLAMRRHFFRSSHPLIAVCLNSIGDILRAENKFREAYSVYDKSLEILNESFTGITDNHSYILDVRHNIAILYYAEGRYNESEMIYRSLLQKRIDMMGAMHPSVGQILNNYASLLHVTEAHEQAADMYVRCLMVKRQVFGACHPDVALAMNNYGLLLKSQGKYEEAEKIYNEALEIQRTTLTQDHPDIAATYNNLAVVFATQSRIAEAMKLFRKSIDMKRKIYGYNDIQVASALNNYAGLLYSIKEYGEAKELYHESMAIRKYVYGDNHPTVAESINNIALLQFLQGQYHEAKALYEQCLAIKLAVYGSAHSAISSSYNNLAGTLHRLGKLEVALNLYNKALEIRKRVVDEKNMNGHTVTLEGDEEAANIMANIAAVQSDISRCTTARN